VITTLVSWWRNDATRELAARAWHLLGKTDVARVLWVVGDSTDGTEPALRAIAATDARVTVLRRDGGVRAEPESPEARLARWSRTVDQALDDMAETGGDDDRVLIHESDLISPLDIARVLHGVRCEAVAGWPVLTLDTGQVFYDTWATRAHGTRFSNARPYHAVYRPDRRFAVDSAGSCWSVPAWAIRAGARCGGLGAVGLCGALRTLGVRIWVDPMVHVEQPRDLWAPMVGAAA
jgi:hypothetical protein